MYEKELMRQLAIALIILVILTFCLTNAGCESWRYQRWEIVDGKAIKVVDARGDSCLVESDIDNVHVEIDGQRRYMSIGGRKLDPDEDAIKSTGGAVGNVVGEAVKAVVGL